MNAKEIEVIVRASVKRMYHQYPQCEWEDLEAQAWLIVTEFIGDYDATRGASLGTYLHNLLDFKLSDYIRRQVLKEMNLNGMRDHADYYDATLPDIAEALEARITLREIMENSDSVSRDILQCMMEGSTQSEAAKELGLSRQYVSQVLQSIRSKYK